MTRATAEAKRRTELEEILKGCARVGNYSAAYKVSRGESPLRKDLEDFMKN